MERLQPSLSGITACFCLALLSLASATPAEALVDERIRLDGDVRIEATFNRPGLEGEPSSRLEDRVVALIGQAAPGSEIRLSIYTFTREDVAEALLVARRKGVTVRVVADSKSLATDDSALEMLMNGNDELPPLGGCDGGCVSVCRAGCHGFHINHNKFLLLSELEDGSRWVVAQSSANFTAGQHRNYNDLLVFHNDRELYATFEAYFDDLDRRLWSPRYYREEETTSGIAVHFFPRLFGPDPIVDILDSVQCDPGSTIRVAHSRFESFRLDVARKLRELSDQGCDVHAILRREPRRFSPGRAVLGELDELATVLPYKGHDIDGKRNAIHTKLMLIKAPHGGSEEPRHLVLTGSHNLSVTSLHLNDEVLLRVDNAALFAAYEKFWDEILQAHEQR